MRLRTAILWIHRWLTFVVGAWFVIVTATGSYLVFGAEIDRAMNSALYRTTPGDVGADSALASVRAAHAGRTVSRIWLPAAGAGGGEGSPVYVGEIPSGRRRHLMVHVDPGNGQVLGTRGLSATEVMRALHINLLGVPRGARIVGIVGLLLVMMSATGLYLWWPGVRKLGLGFRLRWGKGVANTIYDLHNLGGIISLPVVAVTALTGAMLVFVSATQLAVHALWGQRPPPLQREVVRSVPPGAGAQRLPLGDFLRIARDAAPEMTPLLITVPSRPDHAVQVRMYHSSTPSPDGAARVTMDQYTGGVLTFEHPRTMTAPRRFVHRWPYYLHIGAFGGMTTRVLYFVLGLVPVGLAISGVLVWWNRRRGRLLLEGRRAGRTAA
ncbi:MAG: PepSY domain-containing protein [Gemmatimonadota bacterium]|nr:PepSY domain-containing protein [Gemmatimonadota bacterium]